MDRKLTSEIKADLELPMYPGGMEIGEKEKKAVMEVIDGKYLFRYYGPKGVSSRVALFEQEFTQKIGVKYALAVNSCTSALISSLVAVGVGPGDEVIIPGYTFFASCAAVINVKAIPVIAEADESLTLDPRDFEGKITPRTKAVIPVHMRGAPCQMDEIMRIAKKHHLQVVEDVAQASGGKFKNQRLGSFGDCNAFSLQYHKIITSGEGGVVTTDDGRFYERAQVYHDAAACWRPGGEAGRFASERYKGELFPGVNFRMSELTGAVARVQLRRLDGLIKRMRDYKKRIKNSIVSREGLQFRKLNDLDGDTAVSLIFYLPSPEITKKFAVGLRNKGIRTGSTFTYRKGVPDWHIYAHWPILLDKRTPTPEGCPYTCSYYKGPEVKYTEDMCPRTLDLLSRAIHIDIPPQLRDETCDYLVEAINEMVQKYL